LFIVMENAAADRVLLASCYSYKQLTWTFSLVIKYFIHLFLN
jgi:hypothetical protein